MEKKNFLVLNRPELDIDVFMLYDVIYFKNFEYFIESNEVNTYHRHLVVS